MSPMSSCYVRSSSAHLIVVIALAAGCKRTETNESTKPAEAPGAKAPAPTPAAGPTAPAAPAASAAGATVEYTNPQPQFTLRVPAGFVPNEPMQTGPGNTSIRLAKDGEHSGIGTAISVTWWTKDPEAYAQLRGQTMGHVKTKLEQHEIAAGKGKFAYGTATAQRMVEGELKDAKQYIGAAAVEGDDFVLTCSVESFDDPPQPAFIRACETLAVK